ncbi:putative uncharacterized domain protein [Xanthomonas citri pv. punicae str. LMG 859]|nr:putative uncharacterized domain protein [Xanthomonas citri pv. punicae str. LMG 859]
MLIGFNGHWGRAPWWSRPQRGRWPGDAAVCRFFKAGLRECAARGGWRGVGRPRRWRRYHGRPFVLP